MALRRWLLFVKVLMLLFSATSPQIPISVGEDYEQIVPADIDGDGDLDVVVNANCSWIENQGNNVWLFHENNVPEGANTVATGDVNNDGRVDIICGGNGEHGFLGWLENMGAGVFEFRQISSRKVSVVTVADYDNDNFLDILASSSTACDGVLYYKGNGGSWFNLHHLEVIDPCQTVSSMKNVDVDRNTYLDVVMTTLSPGRVIIYKFDQVDQEFSPPIIIHNVSEGSSAVSVAVGDFDGDTYADVAASLAASPQLVWFRNVNGGGETWSPPILISDAYSRIRPPHIVAGNPSGNGHFYIVVLLGRPFQVFWHEKIGTGLTFSAPRHIASYSSTALDGKSVALGDVDGDGFDDVLTSNGQTIAWYGASMDDPSGWGGLTVDIFWKAHNQFEIQRSTIVRESGSHYWRSAVGLHSITDGYAYWEVTVNSFYDSGSGYEVFIGVTNDPGDIPPYTRIGYILGTGSKITPNGSSYSITSYSEPYGVGDVIGVALDLDAQELRFLKNGVDLGVSHDSAYITPVNALTEWHLIVSTINAASVSIITSEGFPPVQWQAAPIATAAPTAAPTPIPTANPTASPSPGPTETPSQIPTSMPTSSPTDFPTQPPTKVPTSAPTNIPTDFPTHSPTKAPSSAPTNIPTDLPTDSPTKVPTSVPSPSPTDNPTPIQTGVPTIAPMLTPTPTRVPFGCGELRNNTRGAPDQSIKTIFPSTDDPAVDFDMCCDECMAVAACASFSFLPGNNSFAGRTCVLFSAHFGIDAVPVQLVPGWISASLFHEQSAGEDLALESMDMFARFYEENKTLAITLLASFCLFVTMWALSHAMEWYTKRNVEQRNNGIDSSSAVASDTPDSQIVVESVPNTTANGNKRDDSGKHLHILFVGLAFIDLIVDWFFVMERFRVEGTYNNEYQYVPLLPFLSGTFVVVPMLGNLLFISLLMRMEFYSPQMRQWFFDHSFLGTMMALLALGNPEVLILLISCTYGSFELGSAFNAPFSKSAREKLHIAGLVGNVLEDFPQLIIQIIVLQREDGALLTRVAIATSGLTLAFGLLRRFFLGLIFCQRNSHERDVAKETARSVTAEMTQLRSARDRDAPSRAGTDTGPLSYAPTITDGGEPQSRDEPRAQGGWLGAKSPFWRSLRNVDSTRKTGTLTSSEIAIERDDAKEKSDEILVDEDEYKQPSKDEASVVDLDETEPVVDVAAPRDDNVGDADN